jgi:hypothetical protein
MWKVVRFPTCLYIQGPYWLWSHGFWNTATYVISAYHHWCCQFESRSGQCVQHYVIKFVSDFHRGFTNIFWTETLVMGPHGKGLNTLWAYDPFLVNVYDNGTTNTMKRHKVCQGSTSTLYMFFLWCSRHFQQYFSSIGRSQNLLIRNELSSSSWIYCQEDKCCHIRNHLT